MKKKRLISLDAFRGLTIALMLLVNNAGDSHHIYKMLEHADWNGCTVADLVFPFFVFIMGVSVPLAIVPQLESGVSKVHLFQNFFRRTAILFGLGVLLSVVAYWTHMDHFRLMGVLQRLAITYFVLSNLMLLNSRSLELTLFWGILILYGGALMMYAYSTGDTSYSFPLYNNLSDFIDTKILGHLNYQFDETLAMGHDPEGVLSTLPTLSSGLVGVFCGRMLADIKVPSRTFSNLLIVGFVLLITGFAASFIIPLNKNIWTPSYVITASGWAFVLLGFFYYLIDLRNWTRPFYPFIAYGSNAITIYFAASLLTKVTVGIKWTDGTGSLVRLKMFLYQRSYGSLTTPYFGDYLSSLLWGMTYVLLFFVIADWMYRKKWFVKI